MSGKVIIVVRHGEAEHNVDHHALLKRNTALTDRGRQQAAAIHSKIRELSPDLVVTSPILRALQTTAEFMSGGDGVTWTPMPQVIVAPDARERVSHREHLCELPLDPHMVTAGDDTRATRSQSGLRLFAAYDWSLALEAAVASGGTASQWEATLVADDLDGPSDSIDQRGVRLSLWLEQRPEQRVCLTSHGAFLMHLTGDDYMQNCEVRVYSLEGGHWHRLETHDCDVL